ncbi:TetR/AcrR family transcriptional regulator [Nocardia inohanensis]|uniref:TetR/AcrR family transcriptional regulator n=1 Tax=Nocardia inohanensis TaxID=209246 RepID=UPI000A02BB16|nr:TetR/AcrR family transcriptional regulator [Nocardia inohanensis]
MAGPTTLELLWGTQQQRPKRGPKPSLTLERIVGEAIALADAEGLANLSMARLAERLGCAKMALYRYVPGKTELAALMADAALGPAPEVPAGHADTPHGWRDYLTEWTVTVFQRYYAHPWGLELAVGVRPSGPNELSWPETALTVLRDKRLTASEQLDAVVLLLGHARSLVQQVATPAAATEGVEERLAEQLAGVLAVHGERYPHLTAALAEQAAQPPAENGRDDALRFGIDRILDGLAALMAARK